MSTCFYCPVPATHVITTHPTRFTCDEHAPTTAVELPHHPTGTPVFATTAEEDDRPTPYLLVAAVGRSSQSPTRIHRWSVHADGSPHPIGTGTVLFVDSRSRGCVEVWTLENSANVPTRRAQAYGAHEVVPPNSEHVGSCLDYGIGQREPRVWHVFALE